MRPNKFWLGLAVATSIALVTTIASAQEKKDQEKKDAAKKIEAADVPAKVMDPVKARFPTAEFTNIEKEVEKGDTVYDFEMKMDGKKYEADVKDDGTIMEIEKQVEEKDLPDAVSKAVKAQGANAKVKEIMEVNKVTGKEEKPFQYEIVLDDGGKEKEIKLALDGSAVKEEGEAEQAKDKEKGEAKDEKKEEEKK